MRKIFSLVLLLIGAGCWHREHAAAGGATPSYPNAPVILISIDTLRADHLPAYGYKGVETPNIDRFRDDAVLFRHAYSHVPLTLPSHVSLLTGELPPDNGVRNNIGFTFDPSKHSTIPMLLKAKGYATGAAVSAYVLRGNSGLAGAFDFYDDNIAVTAGEVVGRLQRPGGESEAIAEQWIDGHSQQPFFFFLHLFEPHAPYTPPEPFRSRYTAVPYDGEIATADAIVGKFIDYLKQKGIYDRATIVLLSDHGEGLNEHGEDEHGIFLYMEDIHVPLLLKLPHGDRAKSTIDAPVQLIDVFPTIAAIAGATAENKKGRSLLEAANAPARRIYSETLYPRIHLGWSDLRSLVDDKFHLIDAPRPELYAAGEPAEKNNVLNDSRRAFADMRKDLEPFSRVMPAIGNIDPEEAKKLAALGYLSASSSDSGGPLPDPKDHIGEIGMLKEAAHLAQEGNRKGAVAEYRALLDKNPRLTDAWTLLAQMQEKEGQYDDAAATYKRGIQLAPSIAGEFSLSLANLYLILNRPDDAIANAQLGVKANAGNAHILIGRGYLAKGQLDVAASEAQQAMNTFNYRVPAEVLLAQIAVKQRRFDEALAILDRARTDVERTKLEYPPLFFFARGDALARMNRIPEAIEAFNEEIRRFPRDLQAYANLTVIYILTGDHGKANETMEHLVAENPSRSSYDLAVRTFTELGDNHDAQLWSRRRQ
jgi:arylsulfatase A-like enzyme/Tfp pilus assembly protein PilF